MSSRNHLYCNTASSYYQQLHETAFDPIQYEDEIRRIKELLQVVPSKQRTLCHWYFVEDFTYQEIARFTNLSPITVKNHIAWSMIILRNYMAKPKAPV